MPHPLNSLTMCNHASLPLFLTYTHSLSLPPLPPPPPHTHTHIACIPDYLPHCNCCLSTCSFNFTAAEMVAILGAHTLGRAVVQDSGFAGPWVPADNVLNNDYYRTLSDNTLPWAQAVAPSAPGFPGKIQWQVSKPDGASRRHVCSCCAMTSCDMVLPGVWYTTRT